MPSILSPWGLAWLALSARFISNVVDFMALLEKSLASRRGPQKKAEPSEGRPAAKKKSATPKKGPAKTRPRKTAKKRESA